MVLGSLKFVTLINIPVQMVLLLILSMLLLLILLMLLLLFMLLLMLIFVLILSLSMFNYKLNFGQDKISKLNLW